MAALPHQLGLCERCYLKLYRIELRESDWAIRENKIDAIKLLALCPECLDAVLNWGRYEVMRWHGFIIPLWERKLSDGGIIPIPPEFIT